MTWVLENDSGTTKKYDSREKALEKKEQFESDYGAELELNEIDEADDGSAVNAEVIEMSGYGGNTDSDDDDGEDELAIVGEGGRPYTFCRNCDRLSACTYRCAGCGADLAGESHYDGELP